MNHAALLMVLLLLGCSQQTPRGFAQGTLSDFAYQQRPGSLLSQCETELGLERSGGGMDRGSNGRWSSHGFNASYLGDEALRQEIMLLLEQRVDEAMAADGLTITGRGRWSPMPGFRRRYENDRQQGILSVYSAAAADGYVYVRGELVESPR